MNATASPPTASARWWWRCQTEAQVQAVLRTCHRLNVPVVARGAGTQACRAAPAPRPGRNAVAGQVQPDPVGRPISRTARVQCGVRNLAISEAAAPHGLYYAPDPSSQIACTIGGNVAETRAACTA